MAQARGSQTTIALFEESTYATDPGTPDGQKLYVTSFGLAKQQNRIDSDTLTNSRARAEPFLGNVNASGAVATEVSAESAGTLYKHLMGTNVTSGVGPYTHTMTVGDLPTSLLLEVDYGSNITGSGRYIKYNGCRINSAQFEFPTEGACTASFDVVGAKAVADSTALDATLTDNGHTTFSSFDAAIEEGGSSIAIVKSVSLTVSNDLDQNGYVIGGGGVRGDLPEGFSSVSGTLTAIFDSVTLMNKTLNDTQSSLKVTVTRGDGLGSAGNESIEFLVQQLKYDPTTPSVQGPGGIEITLPFKAFKSGADLGLQITLKNAVATI